MRLLREDIFFKRSGGFLLSPRYVFGAIFLITLIKYIDCWKFYLSVHEMYTLGYSSSLRLLTLNAHTPLYYSFVFVLLKIFGFSFWVAKIPAIFSSLLLLICSSIAVIKKEFKCFYLALFAIVNLAPTEWYLLRLGRMYGPLLVMSFFVAYMLVEYINKNKINPRLFYPLLGLANFTHATFLLVSFGVVITITAIKWIRRESGTGLHLLFSFLATLPVLGYYFCLEENLERAFKYTSWIDGTPELHWFKEMVYLFLGHLSPHTNSYGYPVDLIAGLLFDLTLIATACFLLFSCLRLPKKFSWGLIGIFLLLQARAIFSGPTEWAYLWGRFFKMIVPIAWILYCNQRLNKKIIFSQSSVFILFFVALLLAYPWKSFWHERYLTVILPFIIFSVAYMLEPLLKKRCVLAVIVVSMFSYNVFVLKIFDQQRYYHTSVYQVKKFLGKYGGPIFMCQGKMELRLIQKLYIKGFDVIPCPSKKAKKRAVNAKYIVLVDFYNNQEFDKPDWTRDFRLVERGYFGVQLFAYQRITTP